MEIARSFSDIERLVKGAVYALPTDTVYGLSCAIDDVEAVKAIRTLKGRDAEKPMIVLVATMRDLESCGIRPTEEQIALLKRIWPGPVSVVFTQAFPALQHIASTGTLAVRMPSKDDLLSFITRVGPIVSTSANISGASPATTLAEVAAQFESGIAYGVDGGVCNNTPSTVLQILR